MKKLIWIPAKAHSERVPNKNFAMFTNMSLVDHTLLKVQQLPGDDVRIVLSTDEPEALKHCPYAFERPEAVRGDDVPLEDVFAAEGHEFDVALWLQVTSPFIGLDTIETMFTDLEDSPCAIGVVQDAMMYFSGQVEDGLWSPSFEDRTSTKQLTNLYRESGGLWGFTREHWDAHHTRTAPGASAVTLSLLEGFDIDTPEDMAVARGVAYDSMTRESLSKLLQRLGITAQSFSKKIETLSMTEADPEKILINIGYRKGLQNATLALGHVLNMFHAGVGRGR